MPETLGKPSGRLQGAPKRRVCRVCRVLQAMHTTAVLSLDAVVLAPSRLGVGLASALTGRECEAFDHLFEINERYWAKPEAVIVHETSSRGFG